MLLFFGVSLLSGLTPELLSSDLSLKAHAAGEGMLNPTDRPTDVVDTEFRTAVQGFMNYFLGFLGLIAVIFVIYAGILMVTAQGEEDQVEKGKKILIWAAAGIIIVLLSYTMVRMILTVPVA